MGKEHRKTKQLKNKLWLAMALCLLAVGAAGCKKTDKSTAESSDVSINASTPKSEETTLPSEDISEDTTSPSEDISEETITINGGTFTGTLKNGKPWQGTFKYKDGSTATLDMDTKTISYENGDVYVGDFKNGLRHGQGKFTWANGDVYEGNFTDNHMDGYGVYTWAEGDTYTGYYKMDLRHGEGTLIIKNGDKTERYTGTWLNDKKHGEGELEYYNGDRYSGPFINGLPDTRTLDENGNFVMLEDGKYQHGVEAIYTYAAGNYYTGYFEAGRIAIQE